jgi:phosphomannomutase
VLPDPDEPVVHHYAEGRDEEESRALQGELRDLVGEILATEESPVGA